MGKLLNRVHLSLDTCDLRTNVLLESDPQNLHGGRARVPSVSSKALHMTGWKSDVADHKPVIVIKNMTNSTVDRLE